MTKTHRCSVCVTYNSVSIRIDSFRKTQKNSFEKPYKKRETPKEVPHTLVHHSSPVSF